MSFDVGDSSTLTIEIDPYDGSTEATSLLTDPSGNQSTPVAVNLGNGVWAIVVTFDAIGEWMLTWIVTGTGAGKQSQILEVTDMPGGLYTTVERLRNAVAPDDNFANTAAMLLDSQLWDHIREAQSIVEGYLTRATQVPLQPPVPMIVKLLTTSIAAWLATLAYRRGKDLSPNDPIALRYAQAMDMLGKIADGQMAFSSLTPDVEEIFAVIKNPYEGELFGTEIIPDQRYYQQSAGWTNPWGW